MFDVFISYSRKNLEFASNINQKLREHQKDVWIDLEDIPPTVEWLPEIERAIANSLSFIFIISPESVTSEICLAELIHAIKLNKKIIPVLFKKVENIQIPNELRSINWIEFTDSSYDTIIELIIAAIDTDIVHTKHHTILLTQAIEWSQKNYEKSILLRGISLKDAQDWLRHGINKIPAPVELQIEFIEKSENAENLRRKKLFLSVSFALIISSILAIISYIMADRAEKNRELAESRHRIAIARQLSLESANQINSNFNDPELGTLLAIEGYKRHPNYQAANILRKWISLQPRLIRKFIQNDSIPNIFEMSNNYIANQTKFNEITIWDIENGDEITKFPHSSTIKSFKLIKNKGLLACVTSDDKLTIWGIKNKSVLFCDNIRYADDVIIGSEDVFTVTRLENKLEIHSILMERNLVYTPPSHQEFIDNYSLKISMNGRIIAFKLNKFKIVIINALTRKIIVHNSNDNIKNIILSPSGEYMIVENENKSMDICKVSSDSLSIVKKLSNMGLAHIRFTENIIIIVPINEKSEKDIYYFFEDSLLIRQINTNYLHGKNTFLSPNGWYLLTTYNSSDLLERGQIWDLSKRTEIKRILWPFETMGSIPQFSPNGEYILFKENEADFSLWKINTEYDDFYRINLPFRAIHMKELISNNLFIFSDFDGKNPQMVHFNNKQCLTLNFSRAKISPDNMWFAAINEYTKYIKLYNVEIFAKDEVKDEAIYGFNGDDFIFTPNSRYLLTVSYDTIKITGQYSTRKEVNSKIKFYSLDDGREIWEQAINDQIDCDDILFSFDSEIISIIKDDEIFLNYEAKTGEKLSIFVDAWKKLCYLPTKSNQIFICHDGFCNIWDSKSGKLLNTIFPSTYFTVDALSISSNGKYLAIIGEDDDIIILNAQNWQKVAEIENEALTAYKFSPDEDYFIGLSNKFIIIYDLNKKNIIFRSPRFESILLGERMSFYYSEVDYIAFHPTKPYFAVVNNNKYDPDIFINVWDYKKLELVAQKQVEGSIDNIIFSNDGKFLISIIIQTLMNNQRAIDFWHWNPDSMLDNACLHVSRNLSFQEWNTFFKDEPYCKTCKTLPIHPSVVESINDLIKSNEIEKANLLYKNLVNIESSLTDSPTEYIQKQKKQIQSAHLAKLLQKNKAEAVLDIILKSSSFYDLIQIPEICNNIGRKLRLEAIFYAKNDSIEKSSQIYLKTLLLLDKLDKLDENNKISIIKDDFMNDSIFDSTLYGPLSIELQKRANELVARTLVEYSGFLVNESNLEQGLQLLQKAKQIDPSVKIQTFIYRSLCSVGIITGRSMDVLCYCDSAIVYAPEEFIHYSNRGIARALTRDYQGAINDFTLYLKYSADEDDEDEIKKREKWLNELKAGKNPFNKDEIEKMFFEMIE